MKAFSWVCVALLLTAACATLVDEASTRGLAGLNSNGMCMGDIDNDGDVDLILSANPLRFVTVYTNDGQGNFHEDEQLSGVISPGGCTLADVDNDGLLDLHITAQHYGNPHKLFRNSGVGFVDWDSAVTEYQVALLQAVAWGDVDNDGDVDQFLGTETRNAPHQLYITDTHSVGDAGLTTRLHLFEELRGFSRGTSATAASFVDVDSDNDLDIVVVGDGELYINDGTGTFSEEAAMRGFVVDMQTLVLGDFNGDGTIDACGSAQEGDADSTTHVLFNDGAGYWAPGSVFQNAGVGLVSAVLDVDHDGGLDVIPSGAAIAVNAGSGVFNLTSLGFAMPNAFAVSGDIDGDLDMDVIVATTDGGRVFVNTHANQNSLDAILILPLASYGTRGAFGAIVRLTCRAGCTQPWTAARVIDGGSGRFGQSAYGAHFGVPHPEAVYDATVHWGHTALGVSNATTHAVLGGIQPSVLSTVADRTFVVQAPVSFTMLLSVEPFNVAINGGEPPLAGSDVTVSAIVEPRFPTTNAHLSLVFTVQGVTISAVPVSGDPGRQYTATYSTPADRRHWPWLGLTITLTSEDTRPHAAAVPFSQTAHVTPGTLFEDVTAQSGAGGMLASQVCVGDVDGDGDIDVIRPAAPATLYFNDGSGAFTPSPDALLGAPSDGDSRGCGLADVNRDGFLDLFVYGDGDDRVLLGNGTGFALHASGMFTAAHTTAAWGDVNGDGHVDVFLASHSSSVSPVLAINDGHGNFEDQAASWGVGEPAVIAQALFVDMSADGHLDLLLASPVAPYYENDGSHLVATDFGLASPTLSAFAVGDIDNDGDLDVIVGDYTVSSFTAMAVLVNNGTWLALDAWLRNDDAPVGAQFIDLDLDSDLDAVMVGNYRWMYRQSSSGWDLVSLGLSDNTGSDPPGSSIVAADVDNDGDVDVMITGLAQLFSSHGATDGINAAIRVRPLTPASSPSAFGATVSVVCALGCGQQWQTLALIDGGIGGSVSGYDAIVAVPILDAEYNVTVTWPGGGLVADHTTHSALGGVLAGGAVVAVQPPMFTAVNVVVDPWVWDREPLPGDNTTVTVTLSPPPPAAFTVTIVVDGVDLSPPAGEVAAAGGAAAVLHFVTAGNTQWPWDGLAVSVTVSTAGDGAPDEASIRHEETVIAGSSFEYTTARGNDVTGSFATGVCFGDIDGDGHIDFFVSTGYQASLLLINDGAGVFEDQAAVYGVQSAASGEFRFSCALGDVDNDGDLDLAIPQEHTTNELFLNAGPGVAMVESSIPPSSTSRSVALGDLSGDGNVDMVVCSYSGPALTVLIGNGTGGFTSQTTQYVGAQGTAACYQPVLVDADGDTYLDLLVSFDSTAADEYHLNTAGGRNFTEVGAARGFASTSRSRGIAVGDVNNDGALDVLLSSSSFVEVYINDGDGSFTAPPSYQLLGTATGPAVALVDINLDGFLDAAANHMYSEPYSVWLGRPGSMNLMPPAFFQTPPSSHSYALAVGDIDGDGDLDVAVSAADYMYVNHNARPGRRHALSVRPLLHTGAQSSFGTVVRLASTTTAWRSTRSVDGGSNGFSQNAYDAHFGLPRDGSTAFRVDILWAGGLYPPATPATHPQLAAVSPSEQGLVVVTPTVEAVEALSVSTPPYTSDVDGVPAAGTTHPILFHAATASGNATGLRPLHATVNGARHDFPPFLHAGTGTYTVTYTTPADDADWPWLGFRVEAAFEDASGTVYTVNTTMEVGFGFEPSPLSPVDDGQGRSACIGDVDADGFADVLQVGSTAPKLYVNDGAGGFTERQSPWNIGVMSSPAVGCAFADMDADGHVDVFFSGALNSEVWRNTGSLLEAYADVAVAAAGGVWGDVDGDSDVDLLVFTGSGLLSSLRLNDGSAALPELTTLGSVSACAQALLVDVDADGDLDAVFAAQAAGEVFLNNGTAGFVDVTAGRGLTVSSPSTGAAAADIFGDGDIDLVLTTTTLTWVFANDGDGFFSGQSVGGALSASAPALLDFDLDGDVDIVASHLDTGRLVLLSNFGSGEFADASYRMTDVAVTQGAGTNIADFDLDGDTDVYVSVSSVVHAGGSSIPSGAPNHGNTFYVRPVSASGMLTAYGAVVRVDGPSWATARVVDGGSGTSSQSMYDILVAVPDAHIVYNVSVAFPGGAVRNATTHPGLAVVPAQLLAPKLLLVRQYLPAAPEVTSLPWPGGATLPSRFQEHTFSVTMPGLPSLAGLTLMVFIGGLDVTSTMVEASAGVFDVTYTTPIGGEDWPVAPLPVSVQLKDTLGASNTSSVDVLVGAVTTASYPFGFTESVPARGCLFDVDADGDIDVFMTVSSTASEYEDLLFLNDGSGNFVEVAADRGAASGPDDRAHGCSFGDIDNDGDIDIYTGVRHNGVNGDNKLFINDGTTHFSEESEVRGVATGKDLSLGVAMGDVDGDSFLDIFLCVDGSTNYMFVNDGTGMFSTADLPSASRNSLQAVMVDVDGDTDLDIVVAEWGDRETLLINSGTGTFTSEGPARGFTVTRNTPALAVADVNGDGAPDLFFGYSGTPNGALFVNDGSGVFMEEHVFNDNPQARGAAAFDFDHDGAIDLLNGARGSGIFLELWLNSDMGLSFSNAGPTVFSVAMGDNLDGVVAGDLDGDGDLDVVVPMSGLLFSNNNAGDGAFNVLLVTPVTPSGAASTFGSVVRVVCTAGCNSPWAATRFTDGGSSYCGQSMYTAHVAVPVPAAEYAVSVRWPADVWPAANATTHPGLGGVLPSSLPTLAQRSFVVRPAEVSVTAGLPPPWPSTVAPNAGDTLQFPVTLSPTVNVRDVVVTGTANGAVLGVAPSGTPGEFTLTYTTVADGETWPWEGLAMDVTATDSSGLVSHVQRTVKPGVAFQASSAGLGGINGAAGSCVGDIDADGDVDVAVLYHASPSQLWLNDGSGDFADASDVWGFNTTLLAAVTCVMVDIDDDGWLDVYVVRVDQPCVLYMSEGGMLAPVSPPSVSVDASGVLLGDADGAGGVDLYVVSPSEANVLLLNTGSGLAASTPAALAHEPTAGAALADVDGDGTLDFVMVSNNAANDVVLQTGPLVWSSRGDSLGFADTGPATAVVVGDFTTDGAADVYVAQSGASDLLYQWQDGLFVGTEVSGSGVSASTTTVLDVQLDGGLDVMVGSELWLSAGDRFESGAGLGPSGADQHFATDVDGDGASDVLVVGSSASVWLNAITQFGRPTWVVVHALTRSGRSVHVGATVVVQDTASSWSAAQVVAHAGGVVVGLPSPDTIVDVKVVYPGGATHTKATQEALGGVTPGSDVTVQNLPYLTAVEVSPATGFVNASTALTITLTPFRSDGTSLTAAPDCCFVNGVQVNTTLVDANSGQYALTYTVAASDPSWPANFLQVVAPLVEADGATMATVAHTVDPSPVGDTLPPAVELTCGPGPASSLTMEPLCVTTPTEVATGGGTTLEYAVFMAGGVRVARTAAAATSATTFDFSVGPNSHGDYLEVWLWATDAAGNTASRVVQWRIDTVPPTSFFSSTPVPTSGGAIASRSATFELGCSETPCTLTVSVDGGPLSPIGGNASAAAVAASSVDTVLHALPTRVLREPPVLVFDVLRDDVTNASVMVTLSEQAWELPVVEGTNTTAPLALPPLPDGVHSIVARARFPDRAIDVTPIHFLFEVDTTPPVATLLATPSDGSGDGGSPARVVADCSEQLCEFQWRVGPAGNTSALPWNTSSTGVIVAPAVAPGVTRGVELRPVDAAGNVGAVLTATWEATVCSPPPALSLTNAAVVPGGLWFAAVTVVGGEQWAPGFEVSVDGGEWQHTAEAFVVVDAVVGNVSVRHYVPPACLAANPRPPPVSASWDATPSPFVVTIDDAPQGTTPDINAVFVVSSTVPDAWLEYRVDGGAWTPGSAVLQLGPLATGDHTFDVRGVDRRGVASGLDAHEWTIVPASDSSVVLSGLDDGEHSVTSVAFDEANNMEFDPTTFLWRVDTTPPVTVANRTSPRFSRSPTVAIDVGCDGEVDPCEFCWTSASVPDGCSLNTTLHLSATADGDHAVDVWAVDSVGWAADAVVRVLWSVDITPPSTAVAWNFSGVLQAPLPGLPSGVEAVLPSDTLVAGATADEAVEGYVVHLDSVRFGLMPAVGGSITVAPLADGVVDVNVAAVDLAGNVDPVGDEFRLFVDGTPPVATFHLPPSPTNATALNVGVTLADAGVGVLGGSISVTQEGGGNTWPASTFHTASVTVPLANLTSGVYNVSVIGNDAAGNTALSWAVIVIDTLPPRSSFAVALPDVLPTGDVVVWVAASEEARLTARLGDDDAWRAANASGAVTFVGVSDGEHTVVLSATDLAGNVELGPLVSDDVTVDTTPPVLTFDEPPRRYTTAATTAACVTVEDATVVVLRADHPDVTWASTSCFTHTLPGDGEVTVTVTGVDAAAHVSDGLSATWTLDTVAPSVQLAAGFTPFSQCVSGSSVVVCASPTAADLALACGAGGGSPCTPQYAVDVLSGGNGAVCGRRLVDVDWEDAPTVGVAFELPTSGDGEYRVVGRAVDAAGNPSPDNVTLVWHVDTVAPASAPTLVQTPPQTSSTSTAQFLVRGGVDASPGDSSFLYVLDSEPAVLVPAAAADTQVDITGVAAGAHTIEWRHVDQGLNAGPPVLYNWQVVDSAPVAVITGQPAAVSGDARPWFNFTATWPMTSAQSGLEPTAELQVSLNGATFETACEDTVATGGVCSWQALLVDGPQTYTLSVRAALGGVAGDPVVFAWEFLLCTGAQFAVVLDNFGLRCEECPAGADCTGDLVTADDLVAQPGFWAPDGARLNFYECPIEEACLPGGTVVLADNTTAHVQARCAVGYTGTLCAVCDDNFFYQFGLCKACESSKGVAWAITAAILAAVCVGLAVLFKLRAILPKDQIKVVISLLQIVGSASTAYDIPWPSAFSTLLSIMRVALVDLVALTRVSCAAPITFYGSLVITLLGFKAVLVAVVLASSVFHKVQRVRQHRRRTVELASTPPSRRRPSLLRTVVHSTPWASIFRAVFLVLFLGYAGVSLKIMKMFDCVEVEGDFWLVVDMRLQCYDGEWFGYAAYAVVMGCLYTAGFPVVIVCILWVNRRKLRDPGVVAKWGFLYETYGEGAYLWEAVELLRKLWLSALVVLMSNGSPLQVTVAVLISGWAHVLHAVFKPWRGVGVGGDKVYVLQHGSLFVTSFVFLMGLLYKVDGVDSGTITYTLVSWVMVLVCVAFIVGAVYVLVTATISQLRASRIAKPVVGEAVSGGKQRPTNWVANPALSTARASNPAMMSRRALHGRQPS